MDILTDGDDFSCVHRNGNIGDSFVVFLNHSHLRHIIFSVIGSHMVCSPVDGSRVHIISTSHQGRMCKVMLSHSSQRCRYECSCERDDICSHIIIKFPGGGDGGLICEIKVG